MRRWAVGALLFAGCGAGIPTVEPVDGREAFVIAETARYAGMLGLRVRGKITDRTQWYAPGEAGCPSSPPIGCYAAGYYSAGVAYFYRPWVGRQERAALSQVACHEVCHAAPGAYLGHTAEWRACMARGGFPQAGETIGRKGEAWVE